MEVKDGGGIPPCSNCDMCSVHVQRAILPCGHGLCVECWEDLKGSQEGCPNEHRGKKCGAAVMAPAVIVRQQKVAAKPEELRGEDIPSKERFKPQP